MSADPYPAKSARPTKPNIVFILSDQHNAKVTGYAGHPDVKTPHLDRLAAEGTRFDAAVTQSPICTPSRTCFHSGQYAHNHGIYNLCGPRPSAPTIYAHFKRHGYATAAIGKGHCPEYWLEDDLDLFHEVCVGCSIGGWPEYQKHVAARGLNEAYAIGEGRGGPYGQCMDGYENPMPYRDSPEGWVVDQSRKFIADSARRGQPFLINVSFPRPHQTYAPTREFWEMYDERAITLPPNFEWDLRGKAPHLIETNRHTRSIVEDLCVTEPKTHEALFRRKLCGYLGNVSMVDHAVGELLDTLDTLGIADNTIVIYTSDHGDYAAEHGILEKAPGICSDAITRIPYLWRWPGTIQAAQVKPQIAEAVDLAPTLCALAGIERLETTDGQDLSKLLAGGEEPVHAIGVTEFAWSKSARQGDWRYVYYPQEMFAKDYPGGFGELYNLAEDPYEMRNRYFDADCQDRVKAMERALLDWLVTTTRVVGTNCVQLPEKSQGITRFKVRTRMDGKIGGHDLRDYISSNRNYL
jgi:arylsulfatase